MVSQALQFSPVQRYLEGLLSELSGINSGDVANYIPELSHADSGWLGIALVTVDGHVYQVGDSRQTFTVQSISKAITYGLALEDRGLDYVLRHVGVEPSGEAFNSISLEPDTGRPLNPMINAGAIATTGMIKGLPDADPMTRILDTFARFTGHPVTIDEKVYRSESDTGHRNRAIAYLMYGYGVLDRTPEEVLDLYFRQCSILVTARDLAGMGACLANNGVNPVTGVVALKSQYVEKVLSVMSTCGMYDYSGGWIFNVGMPAKSGVGGGIMAVLPGQFALGVFSPPLDEKGNSVRGIEACKRVSSDFRLHLFHVARSTSGSVIRKVFDCARYGSRRRRSEQERALLMERGKRIRIYELQGDLLFGSAESVAFDILESLDEVDYLILDLKRVVAIDEASASILAELWSHFLENGKALFFTDFRHLYRFSQQLRKSADDAPPQHPLRFDDTDHAIEWCENQVIQYKTAPGSSAEIGLAQQHLCTGMSNEQLEYLQHLGVERAFAAGTGIFDAGDPACCLYFLLHGEVEVSVDTDSGHPLRVTTIGPGMVFGEVALLNDNPRSATVTAVTQTKCLEIPFSELPDSIRTAMLVNMASYFARKIEHDTELIQLLG